MRRILRPLLECVLITEQAQPLRWAKSSYIGWYSGKDPLWVLQQAGFAKKGKQSGKGLAADSADSTQDAIQLDGTRQSMNNAVNHLQEVLAAVRVGRASPGMLDALKVDIYGDRVALKAVGSVSVRDSQMLAVSPFDPQALKLIEKAVRESPLKLNPRLEGQELLIPVPKPNADTIKAMGKMIKQEGESTRQAIRAARRTVLDQVKKLASKDAQRQEEKKVQKLTDDFIRDVDGMCEGKEAELNRI
ncbi:hypothetical protein CVIRNUC_000680 [Coccomyxa viridis]|uniref:Ribosome-recycling factor, chloroplastic n=1 Tax=Coccomyxa viridis TaxID=1274662 RepID=A0AAV1HQZ9_9CHLO|nr:hypothetical protein CVIRNUC_000680 [Coccomyxa viridis]